MFVQTALVLTLSGTFPIPADTKNAHLQAAVQAYEAFEADKALEELNQAHLVSGNRREDWVSIWLLTGVVHGEAGQKKPSVASFASALAFDPNAKIPNGMVTAVIECFDKAKTLMKKGKSEPDKVIAPASPGAGDPSRRPANGDTGCVLSKPSGESPQDRLLSRVSKLEFEQGSSASETEGKAWNSAKSLAGRAGTPLVRLMLHACLDAWEFASERKQSPEWAARDLLICTAQARSAAKLGSASGDGLFEGRVEVCADRLREVHGRAPLIATAMKQLIELLQPSSPPQADAEQALRLWRKRFLPAEVEDDKKVALSERVQQVSKRALDAEPDNEALRDLWSKVRTDTLQLRGRSQWLYMQLCLDGWEGATQGAAQAGSAALRDMYACLDELDQMAGYSPPSEGSMLESFELLHDRLLKKHAPRMPPPEASGALRAALKRARASPIPSLESPGLRAELKSWVGKYLDAEGALMALFAPISADMAGRQAALQLRVHNLQHADAENVVEEERLVHRLVWEKADRLCGEGSTAHQRNCLGTCLDDWVRGVTKSRAQLSECMDRCPP